MHTPKDIEFDYQGYMKQPPPAGVKDEFRLPGLALFRALVEVEVTKIRKSR